MSMVRTALTFGIVQRCAVADELATLQVYLHAGLKGFCTALGMQEYVAAMLTWVIDIGRLGAAAPSHSWM